MIRCFVINNTKLLKNLHYIYFKIMSYDEKKSHRVNIVHSYYTHAPACVHENSLFAFSPNCRENSIFDMPHKAIYYDYLIKIYFT